MDFDSYFFDAKSNVMVNGPYTLDVLGSAKGFDIVESYKSTEYLYEFTVGTLVGNYSGDSI